MKKIILCLCIVSLAFASCKSSKDCGCPYPVSGSVEKSMEYPDTENQAKGQEFIG
ncbi:hypothetical protein [Dysgonomonas sp. 520]|uniref:hypothetical protein n=1 Tax=Dysgonomonas sp. 520 TaxID=2302931 RepID=UPI0013D5F3F3|nr:hypothetical protein [Dysgonomonas sp. 520]